MRLPIAIITASLLIGTTAFGQNEDDAYRFSNLKTIGTSRYQSTGGAMGALGGDFTSLSNNPAGIAVYRKSELSISPYIQFQESTTNHLGGVGTNNDVNSKIGSAGYVYSSASNKNLGSFSMGFGYNRLQDFQGATTYSGINTSSSLIDQYADDYVYDPYWNSFGDSLAWETYLFDSYIGNDSVEYVYTELPYYGQEQRNIISENGSAGETVFSMGGSVDNKLYIGATFAWSRYTYDRVSTYSEYIPDTTVTTDLTDFTLTETLQTRGNGRSLKLGLIYRLSDNIRLGYAFHSPTWITMKDVWTADMNSAFYTGEVYSASSPTGLYNYKMVTPVKNQVSFAYLFGKRGFVSAEYELVDYGNVRLRPNSVFSDYTFSTENDAISSKFGAASNIRIGGEMRTGPVALRAGYRYLGSGIQEDVDGTLSTQIISGGVGYRNKGFFWDAGINYETRTTQTYLYDAYYLGEDGMSTAEYRTITAHTSIGFKF